MPERDIVERLRECGDRWDGMVTVSAAHVYAPEAALMESACNYTAGTTRDLLRAAAAEIERLRADAGWVRVEDPRRPDVEDTVICAQGAYVCEAVYWGDDSWRDAAGNDLLPTHWRPLPPAPERGA